MTSTALRPTVPFAMYHKYANAIQNPFNLDTSDDFENSSLSNIDKTPNKKRTYQQQRLKYQKSNAKRKEKIRLEQAEQVQAAQATKTAQVQAAQVTQTAQAAEEEKEEEDLMPHKRNIKYSEVSPTNITLSKRNEHDI